MLLVIGTAYSLFLFACLQFYYSISLVLVQLMLPTKMILFIPIPLKYVVLKSSLATIQKEPVYL